MTPSNNLFDLIKSMSKDEKKNFKIFAQTHVIGKKNKYLSIFEAIAKLKMYDEEKLKSKLKEKKLIQHLSANKRYLFQLILKSLKRKFSTHHVNFIINDHFESAIILQEKGLIKMSLKQLNKAKQLAINAEAFPDLIKIIDLQLDYEYRSHHNLNAPINEYFQQEQEALHSLKEITITKNLSNRVYSYTNESLRNKDKKFLEKYSKNVKQYLPSIKQLNSFTAKIIYYNDFINYYVAVNKNELALQMIQDMLSDWDSNPLKKQLHIKSYFITVANVLRIFAGWKQWDQIFINIKRLDEIEGFKESRNMLTDVQNSSKGNTLIALLGSCNFEGAKLYMPTIIAWLTTNPVRLDYRKKKVLWFLFATTCLIVKEYKKGIQWLLKIINEAPNIRIDIISVSKIMTIVIHFELKNYDSVNYMARDTRKYLLEKNRLHPFENKILDFFEKDIDALTKVQLIKFKNECQSIIKTPVSNYIIQYFDFISWIESRIENKSFAEVLKSKDP